MDGHWRTYLMLPALVPKVIPLYLLLAIVSLKNVGHTQIMQPEYFNVNDGLASSFISDVMMGRDGYLWLAYREAGLARFDGVRFENFSNIEALSSLNFATLHQDSQGVIWAGGDQTLAYFDGHTWQSKKVPGQIQDLAQIDNNHLLVCTNQGVWLFDAFERVVEERYYLHDDYHAVVVHEGGFFLGSDMGLRRFDPRAKSWSSLLIEDPIVDLAVDDGGRLWILKRNGTLVSLEGEGMESTRLPHGAEGAFVLPGDLGNYFVGTTDDGLFVWQDLEGKWQQVSPDRVNFGHVSQMVFDSWENAWVATMGAGLIKLSTQFFAWKDQRVGLSSDFITNMIVMQDQSLWVTHRNGRSDIIVGDNIINVSESNLHELTTLTECTYIWAVFENALVYVADTFASQIEINGEIHDVLPVDRAACLVGTSTGVLKVTTLPSGGFEGSTFHVDLYSPIFVKKFVGSGAGVWCISNDQIYLWKDEKFMSVFFDGAEAVVPTCLSQYGDLVILGTEGHGIYQILLQDDALSLRPIDGQDILPSLRIDALQFDGQGYLYVGSSEGIFRTEIGSNNQLLGGYLYNHEIGLPRFEISRGASGIDDGGNLYFGTTTGLLKLQPYAKGISTVGPVIHVQSLESDYQAWDQFEVPGTIRLGNSDQNLLVSVKAIDHKWPKGLQYQWQLDNHRADWVTSSTGGKVWVPLSGVRHSHLRVRAVNRDGISSRVIEFPIQVDEPWWQKGWALLLFVFCLLALLTGLHKLRTRRLLRGAERRASEAEMQNELLRLEQAALRLQMNPHFIFNALQSIQHSISQGDSKDARRDLQSFSKLMRQYLEQARREEITLEEEVEALRTYLEIEQKINKGRFDFELLMPPMLDPSFYTLPPMLIQPFVENAVKHGLPRNGTKGHLRIQFDWKGKYLICTVTDNGPGIRENTFKNHEHKSAGMEVTVSRLRSLLNGFHGDPFTLRDRQDEASTSGTEVQIVLPIIQDEE